MPLPKSADVGKTMTFLKREKPHMALAQRRAIALNQSRKHGAKIPTESMVDKKRLVMRRRAGK